MFARAFSRWFPRWRWDVAACVVVCSAFVACATPKVEVESRPGAEPLRRTSVSVELDGSQITRDDGQGPDFETDLLDESRRILAEQGHTIVARERAALRILIEPKSDSVLLRTWSSEPENNSIEEVERDVAAVRVRAIDASADHDVWRSEARSRLPRVHVPFTPSRTTIWSRTLAAAFEEFDPKRD